MIINTDGDALLVFCRDDGIGIQTGLGYLICIEYNEEQKAKYAIISECTKKLEETDYKAIKYAEGLIPEEEYEQIKNERQKWRDLINENEFEEPTLTQEEMERIIAKAKEKGN